MYPMNINTPATIALMLIASIVLLVFTLAFMGRADSDVFKVLVGALVSVGFTNIVGFYFGSSASSKSKDDTISTMAVAAGTGAGGPAAVTAAARAAAPAAAAEAAPAAAAVAAPPAAAVATPPVVEAVVPPAVEAAVAKAFAKQEQKSGDT